MIEVDIDFRLRPHQLAAYQARIGRRWAIRVWHRRAGKTFAAVAELLIGALESPRPDHRGFYIGPTFAQAKSIAWDYLKRFTGQIPGCNLNESELRADLPTGGRLQLLGAENYHRLRGIYADDVVLDETALIPSEAWTQVLLPALADRQGRALVQGTPLGRMNLFHDLWEEAQEQPDEWASSFLTCNDTDALRPEEIERLRRRMPRAEFEQEMLCSWDAAIKGAFWGEEVARMEAQGRITSIRYDNSLPVVAALDLGWSDAMVVGFWQVAGTEHHCLLAEAYELTSIPDMIARWRELPWKVDQVVLPHDARVSELGTGKTRQEVFHSLGCNTVIAPNLGLHEGIEQARQLLGHVWLDREGCRTLREALSAYRADFVEVRGVYRRQPLHDWSSHWADMLRYYATGRPANPGGGWGDNEALYAARAKAVI